MRAEFEDLVPVLDRLGVLVQALVGPGSAQVAIEEKLFGLHPLALLSVDGGQGADGFREPNQTVARPTPAAEQSAEVASTATQVALILGHGGEVGGQLLLQG